MNIAFVGYFDLVQVNGVSYSGYQLAQYIAKGDHRMYIYNFGSETRTTRHANGIVERTFKYTVKKIGWSSEFSSFVARNEDQIDLFHIHSVFIPYNFFASLRLNRMRKPYVVSPHGGFCAPVLQRNRLAKMIYWHLFESRVVKRANGMIAVTDAETNDLRSIGYKGSIRVIPNAVTLQNASGDQTDPTPSPSITMVYLGRYDIQHKGLDFLLDTFKILSVWHPNLSLRLYGDGADRDTLLEKVKTEKIASVKILSPVFGAEKEKILQAATIFFQPSKWEVFGISLIEAMLAGKPVIVTEGCYLSDLLKRHRLGLIIPFNANRAAPIISQYLLSGRLESDGKRNRTFAQNEFNIERVAGMTLDFYREIMQPTSNKAKLAI